MLGYYLFMFFFFFANTRLMHFACLRYRSFISFQFPRASRSMNPAADPGQMLAVENVESVANDPHSEIESANDNPELEQNEDFDPNDPQNLDSIDELLPLAPVSESSGEEAMSREPDQTLINERLESEGVPHQEDEADVSGSDLSSMNLIEENDMLGEQDIDVQIDRRIESRCR